MSKYIKIALEKPNRTYISLNIAEIIPITDKKECDVIRKALEEEIQSETIKNDEEVKMLLELYRGLWNNEKSTDEVWSCAAKYVEKDIYMASKLLKYALILENYLAEWKKKISENLMGTLNEKAEYNKDKADAAQVCVLLSHFCALKAKFDPQHKEVWNMRNKGAEYIEKAGDIIEKIWEENKVKYVGELMNLQWRCYESATRKYDELSDFQKALEIRVKLNKVFERITERHPFASPIIDNVFENFNETTNLIKKYLDVS